MSEENGIPTGLIVGIVTAVVLTVGAGMAGCPAYKVYSSRMEGEAELANANYSKQVAVQTALAKRNAASMLAEAEIIRAGGVARANQIIGESLKGNDAYLRYLWIDKLDQSKGQIVYVPTEAGLPILEAGRSVHQ